MYVEMVFAESAQVVHWFKQQMTKLKVGNQRHCDKFGGGHFDGGHQMEIAELFSPPRVCSRARSRKMYGGWSLDSSCVDPYTGKSQADRQACRARDHPQEVVERRLRPGRGTSPRDKSKAEFAHGGGSVHAVKRHDASFVRGNALRLMYR